MDQPLEKWYCNECGEKLEEKEGYVNWWDTDVENKAHNFSFRIVHQFKCEPDNSYSDSHPLSGFLGEDGLSYLLSFISLGRLTELIGNHTETRITDFDEFADFFRRVQTPYYEEARRYFGSDVTRRLYYDWCDPTPYKQKQLKEIIQQNKD